MEYLIQNISPVLTGELVVGDQTSLFLFANEPQSRLRYASKSMAEIAMRSTADIELTIHQVLREIESFGQEEPRGVLGSIFSHDGVKRSRLVKKYEALLDRLNKMALALQLQQAALIKENVQLKNLEPILEDCCSAFDTHIASAEALLEKLSEGNCLSNASPLSDGDITEWKAGLARKLEDVRISRTVALQNIAQIKILRNNNQQIIETISAAVTNTIPTWRTQVVLSLNIERMKTEISFQNSVSETLNRTAPKSGNVLKARPQHDTVDYGKLKVINRDLTDVLSELARSEKEDSEIKKGMVFTPAGAHIALDATAETP